MRSLFWVLVFLLLQNVFCLFEWVHPDEWQPIDANTGDETLGEKASHAAGYLKDKAGQAAEKAKDSAHRVGESIKEASGSVMEGAKDLGEDVGDRLQNIRRYALLLATQLLIGI